MGGWYFGWLAGWTWVAGSFLEVSGKIGLIIVGGGAGLMFGILTGLAQWLVLRSSVPAARRWLVCSELGWALAGSMAALALPQLPVAVGDIAWLLELTGLGLVFGAVGGAVTGITMDRILVFRDDDNHVARFVNDQS